MRIFRPPAIAQSLIVLFSLLWTAEGWNVSKIYDVTTIYRYDKIGVGSDGIIDNAQYGCDLTKYKKCNWFNDGWTLIDTAQSMIPIPEEDRKIVETKSPNILQLIPIKSHFKEWSVVITVKTLSEYDTVYLYLSRENDRAISDVNIISIPFINNGGEYDAKLYKCKKYESLKSDLPNERRTCVNMKSSSGNLLSLVSPEYNHILLRKGKSGFDVVLLNTGKTLLTVGPEDYEKMFVPGIQFIGVNQTHQQAVFHLWTPVNVLALTKRHGVLAKEVNISSHSGQQIGLCISIYHYLEPGSDAQISVMAVLSNTTEIVIGISTAPKKARKNNWTHARFVGEFDSDAHIKLIKVISEMNSDSAVFIRSIDGCTDSDVVNTTKINRGGSVEIHARNNAFGLPFISPEGKVLNAHVGVDVEPCIAPKKECNWIVNNFTSIRTRVPLKLIMPSEWKKIEYNKMLSAEPFYDNLEFIFYTSQRSGELKLFLMDEGNLDSAEMYYMRIQNNYNGDLWKCFTGGNDYVNIGSGYNNRRCRHLQSAYLGSNYWQNTYFTFSLKFLNKKIEVYVQSGTTKQTLFNLLDDNPIEVKQYIIGTYNMDGNVFIQEDKKSDIWVMEELKGSIVSPSFIPRYNRICISVTYFALSENVIKLYLHQANGEISEFANTQSIDMNALWKKSIYYANITDLQSQQQVFVQLEGLSTSLVHDPLIQRIAGCNGKGNGDKYIVSLREDFIDVDNYAYDVAVRSLASHSEERKCYNGGVFRAEYGECVCPPGFIGSSCEVGCGKNKYGFKCGGRCSYTTEGCKGMQLCRPMLGCSCGPGLRGILCDISCTDGEYGAGCKQKCGKCSEKYCDIYTGQCPSGCMNGYYPPLCQDEYQYVEIPPDIEVIDFHTAQVTFDEDEFLLYQKGRGSPRFYQLQLRETNDLGTMEDKWQELEPHLLPFESKNITDLKPGIQYQLRIVLLDRDGNSYQGSKVPFVYFTTKCSVPKEVQYQLHEVYATENEFQIAWNYTNESPLHCKAIYFEVEVEIDSEWITHYKGQEKTSTFSKMLPGLLYAVRIRTVTQRGPAPYSDILLVNTKEKAPEKVTDLHLETTKLGELQVKWNEPFFTAGKIHRYKLSYECQKLLGCSHEDCSYASDQVEVITTSAILRDLLPHAQYSISVAALTAEWGPVTQLLAVTDMTVPGVSPDLSSTSITQQTNSSFTVHWQPPNNCSYLNGYLYGYRYQLLGGASAIPIAEGSTQHTSASFSNLTPHTEYTIRVFVVTSGGWSSNHPLLISAMTRATVPGPVENMIVYKKGRRMLGLRWDPPKEVYGILKSFNITYKTEKRKPISLVVKPTPCVAWPKSFCHSSNSLQADTEYTILVQARNDEVDEDGEPASVTAITKEGSPSSPSYIRVDSQTQTSMTLEWGLPDMVNGVLRSFLVNVEETDSYNSSECCQYFPIQEEGVQSEQASYQTEISDLQPASTYTISVTAKTVSLGPAVTITAHTQPPEPDMDHMLEMLDNSNSLLGTQKLVIHPSMENEELIRGYLLLVIPQSSVPDGVETEVHNEQLHEQLKSKINGTFYIAAEFTQGELEDNNEVTVGAGSEKMTGKWGEIQDPALQAGDTYRIGLALILEYCGVLNVGYIETDVFSVKV